jgi:GNAT superfamily N-acetyltransferase
LTIRVEPLDPSSHERSGFECGNPTLDDWLRRFAHQSDARANTGRTWVAIDDERPTGSRGRRPVVGYVTVAAHAVRIDEARAAAIRGSLPDPVPAALIARLAVDRRQHGNQLGGRLLRFAVERILDANTHVAVTLVVADAIDQAAAAFYQHHGFVPVPGTRRLLGRTSDLAAALDL